MTRKGSFRVDVFDCTVHIVLTDSIKRSINYHLRKHNVTKDELLAFEPSGFFCKPDPERIGDYYILFLNEDLAVDIVNHEKCHLVEQILTDRDIKPIDEIRSYLDGYISSQIDLFFKKRKIKVKNKR